eukprot:4241548-Alexandrium_andersonii.AAC.1
MAPRRRGGYVGGSMVGEVGGRSDGRAGEWLVVGWTNRWGVGWKASQDLRVHTSASRLRCDCDWRRVQ